MIVESLRKASVFARNRREVFIISSTRKVSTIAVSVTPQTLTNG